MKNSWLIWVFIVGVVITVLVAFNYQGGQDAIPLSEIFPDEDSYPVDIEYEFVDSEVIERVPETAAVPERTATDIIETRERVPVVTRTPKTVSATSTPVTTAVASSRLSAPVSTSTKEIQQLANTAVLSERQLSDVGYTIQVASFKDKKFAEDALAQAKAKNYPAYIGSRNLGAKGTWYRIYIGKFSSKGDAQQLLTRVKKDYRESFIIAPKKTK